MNTTPRRTLPALVLAAVVLAVAFAGGATAASLITGQDIKNGTVSTKDVTNQSLKGNDVKNASLKGVDVKDGSLGEADLNQAAKNKLNAPLVKGYEVVTATEVIESDGAGTAYVACTAGKVAVGGGGYFKDLETTVTTIEGSRPMRAIRGDSILFAEATAGFADGWAISGKHTGLDPQNLTAYAICVSPN